jgi:putative addiction module component (TIGR02574 family)
MANKRLKNKIHAAVEKTEDDRLLSMINLVLDNQQSVYDDPIDEEQKKELDAALKEWESGKGKTYSWEEAKANILSKRRKKRA